MNYTNTTLAAALVALLAVSPAYALGLGVRANAQADFEAPGASTTRQARVEARMDAHASDAQARAGKEIDRRMSALDDLASRISSMARVSGEVKTGISSTISAQVAALVELKAKIAAETDPAALKADVQSITKSYRIFALVMPQGRISAAADRIKTSASTAAALSTKLGTRITAAQQAGKDVSALISARADMDAKITDASAQADAAVALVANLKPDNGDVGVKATNDQALKDARAKIQVAMKDLQQIRTDADTIVKGLKALGVSASVNASTSVSVQ